ncbi:MAG: hypothetical protein NTY09_02865 [bacterium]|nr:hypothetical protein [bacterium]
MEKQDKSVSVCRILGGVVTGMLGIIGLVWGIVSLVLAIVLLIPLLGWINWIILPIITLGVVVSILAAANPDTKTLGTVAIVLNSSAFVICVLRLVLGGGIM